MSGAEWAMLGAGLALIMAAGAWHLGGILLIKRLKPDSRHHPHLAVLITFWGLVLLHFSEIVLAALFYALVLSFPGAGSIREGYGEGLGGLIYFSGISFATLGFTQQIAAGPIRLLAMLQSLGGFMLITWSATFVYSIWDERFRQTGNDEAD
jgi:hypothetical protein